MKRTLLLGAALLVAATLATTPAFAQYANEFSLAKVKKQGTTSQTIAGSGQVLVQVQVNADGTHKVIRIISSTNHGDDAAATELAQTATYTPAHRGTKPVSSFYDYTLKFNGKSAAAASDATGGSASTKVDALIRAGKYSDAISEANNGLANSPNDANLQVLLGIAQYYSGDKIAAAQSFDKVPAISKQFANLAAAAYADAAVQSSMKDPAQSLSFAQKGMTYGTGANNQFALGVADIANDKYADGIAVLKPLRANAADPELKKAMDRQLLTAYLGNNDPDDANTIAAEMKQLDPTGNAAAVAIGNYYLNKANAAMQAKDYPTALSAYDQVVNSTDTQVSVTANTGAAFASMQGAKPDYNKAKGYALKAVQGAPDNPEANFAVGLAYQGIYVSSSHGDGDKQTALTYLKKAEDAAKAAGNDRLASQIDKQIQAVQQNGQ